MFKMNYNYILEKIKKYKESLIILFFQISYYFLFFYYIFNYEIYFYQVILIILMYVMITFYGISVFYHRYFTHKSFKTKRFYKIMGLFFGMIALTGPVIPWVATHREHHRFSDTEKDPHSPTVKGFLYVHFFPYFYIPNLSYAKDLLLDRDCLIQYKIYNYFHFLILFSLFFIPYEILFSLFFAPFVFVWNIGNLTNSILHSKNGPINNKILSFLVGGEGSHKNHHDDPRNCMFNKKYFFDFGYWLFIKNIKK